MLPPGERAKNAHSNSPPSLLSRFTQYYLVAMAMSLEKSENKVQIYYLHPKRFIWWKDRENRSTISGDIRLNTPVFWPCRTRHSQMSSQLWSYWSEVHKVFTQYRGIIYAVNAHIEVAISHSVSECQSDESRKFVFFSQNRLPWQFSLIEKRGQIDHLHLKHFHSVNRLRKSVSCSWDNCSLRSH